MNCFLCQEVLTSFPRYLDHLTVGHGTPPVFTYKCTACIPTLLFRDVYRFKRHISGQHLCLFRSPRQPLQESTRTPLRQTVETEDDGQPNLRSENVSTDSEKEDIENQSMGEDAVLDLNARLREKVLNFSLGLYSKTNLTRNDVVEIQTSITEEIVKPLLQAFSTLSTLPENEYKQKLINDLHDPFNFIATEHKFNCATRELGLNDNFQIVDFEDKELQVKSNACLMPIKHQIKSFFESPGVYNKTVENMKSLELEKKSSNVVNTSLWKSIKQQSADKMIMPYFLYSDEAEMNDAIGAHSGTHKVCSLYYSFPTIPSHLLSRLDNIFVAGFVKASDMAKLGPSKALHDLIDVLVDLEANGLDLQIESTCVKVHFVLVGILGDNLGMNMLMGFAPSFSSIYYCRFCKINKYDAQSAVALDGELNRTKDNYKIDLEKPYKETGIKENSEFNRLRYYHVADFTIVDAMHDLFSHGICSYDISLVLSFMIQNLHISLSTINYRIQMFNFGETENRNTFKQISREQIKSTNYKMTAREMMLFVHYFPLIFGEIMPVGDDVWNFILSLVELVDIVLLPSFDEEMLNVLEKQITYHHSMYIKTFNNNLKPKYHILLHYVQTIKNIGPPRYTWSFRFEAAHQIFKKYCRTITSRRNICLTLCKKANTIFINNLKNQSHFAEDLEIKRALKMKLVNLPYFSELEITTELLTSTYYTSNAVKYKGTDYRVGYFLTISINNMRSVKLYEIKDLLVKDDQLFIACREWVLKGYVEHYASFEVQLPLDIYVVINANRFDGPPIHLYRIGNEHYVRLKKYFV